jgi:hypothetical protein
VFSPGFVKNPEHVHPVRTDRYRRARRIAGGRSRGFSEQARAHMSFADTERTWEELRHEVQHRADRGLTPFIGLEPDDARDALARIGSLDRDAWGTAWIANGDRFMDEAERARDTGVRCALRLRAWHNYSVGRWPAPLSEAKERSYLGALEAFRAAAPLLDPPVQTLRIDSADGVIVAHLRLPAGARPAPVVLTLSGLDSRKEDDIAMLSDTYLDRGIGVAAVDMPGTGEAPLRNQPGAERMYSRVLDALQAHPDVDAGRIAVRGRSWGSYWAAVLGIVERDRLRGAVVHGGPVHHYFCGEWQRRSLATREYLFDFYPALASVYGATSFEDYLARVAPMSLVARGLIDRPSAPMLVANGVKDTLVPIDDLYLLLGRGSAKTAWVNPQGAHMGRSSDWPQLKILGDVIVPWISDVLDGPAPTRNAPAE